MKLGIVSLAVCIVLACAWLCAYPAPSAPAAATFSIDPVHSSLVFKINHMGVSNVWGRFNQVTGSYVIDDADPAASHLSLRIDAATIDTHVARRDEDLKSKRFFDVEQYPTITYESDKIMKKGPELYEVNGKLTMHGVTKPLTLEVKKIGERDLGGHFGYRSGYESTFKVKRSDYGVSAMVGPIGDEVTLFVDIEGAREKAGQSK